MQDVQHSNAQIWVIDDDRTMRWVLEQTLSDAGYQVSSFENALLAWQQLEHLFAQPENSHDNNHKNNHEHQIPRAIISDIRMPELDGLSFLAKLQAEKIDIPVIIMTAHSDLDSAVSSYQTGAFDYLPKPFDIDEALSLVQRAILSKQLSKQQSQPNDTPTATQAKKNQKDKATDLLQHSNIIGESPAMQDLFRAIGRLSQSHITVLINGESGTGKELVAQALHHHSPRKNNAFIALNMAAIPKDLIESELFGHEKGAFTGANTQRQGRFEQAHGGTLFLDEIGDMPFEAQTRLLRVLAAGEFYRVGGHTPVKANVRIIAATHQDLEKLVKEGKFREDLYHRLNVIRLVIPRLAERSEDIAQLAQYFLYQAAKEMNVDVKILQPETIAHLQTLPWQGNVRQLENTCRWLTVMVTGQEIYMHDLPAELQHVAIATSKHDAINPPSMPIKSADWQTQLQTWAVQQLAQGEQDILTTASIEMEKVLLNAALNHTQGRKQHAAQLLGWGRNTLARKLKELGLENDNSNE
ncbi:MULTISPECIES: nitrogen regulation protein NR(I) [unclassified Acinetobacter]|uniref:nitrogen regulation protein NR(I) n=1 Tax=unclassified Acinetobacter TaxID=196816 RepID=UPI0035B8B3F1